MTRPNAHRTARERAREELTREITDAARRHLAEHGSAGLSLRAIARELGMVSSAVYRYFPSRDDLLTALIIDAYTSVADAAEQADASIEQTDPLGRWQALTRATREWAVSRPQEYALIFGTPVPGYQAPRDTIDPAARIPLAMVRIVLDAIAARGYSPVGPDGAPPAPDVAPAPEVPPGPDITLPAEVASDLAGLRAQLGPTTVDDAQLGRMLMAWTQLIGLISFELFGHLHNVIHDYPAHFDYQMLVVARGLGL